MKTIKVFLFLLCISFVSKSQPAQIIRGPYLQKGTTHSMTIRWRTTQSIKGKVSYREEDTNNIINITENQSVIDHEIELLDLKPGTKYYYEIGQEGSGITMDGEKYFNTFPQGKVSKPFRIKVTGDFGVEVDGFWAPTRERVYNAFKNYNAGREIDMWMWLGDNAYPDGTDQQFQTNLFGYYDKKLLSNTPIAPVVGNHEFRFQQGSEYTRAIPYFDVITVPMQGEGGGVPSGSKAYFSFDVGNFHFVGLDTYGRDNGKKIWEYSKQYDWLKADLAANTKQWTIVFMHHPPYAMTSHSSDTDEELVKIRELLVPLFDQYKVDLVLSGHNHMFQRSYLIKDHLGVSSTFKYSKHVIQDTNGNYDTKSAPFINKDEGTIYAIVGSSGKLDYDYFPTHPIAAKRVSSPGGTMILTLEDNRVDAVWVDENTKVQDKFTIFKEVNKKDTISVLKGQNVTLSASWPGEYKWSHDNSKNRSVTLMINNDVSVNVKDPLGYLKDQYFVKCVTEPIVSVNINSIKQEPCKPGTISGKINIQNIENSQLQYSVTLSDQNGSFSNPLNLGITTDTVFVYNIPLNLVAGKNYKVKVSVFGNQEFGSRESSPFNIVSFENIELNSESSSIDQQFKAEESISSTAILHHNAIYKSGHIINLNPGFSINSKEGVFEAKIEDCGN